MGLDKLQVFSWWYFQWSLLLCNTNIITIRSLLPHSLACDVTNAHVCKYSELSYYILQSERKLFCYWSDVMSADTSVIICNQ